MSRVHGTIYRTTRMLVFDVRQDMLPPVPDSQNGLSLARNDACATITRSMLPPCFFDSARKISAPPFGFTHISRALPVPAIPTPLEASALESASALRIEAFNRFSRQKPAGSDFHLARRIVPSTLELNR
jgi:hypothetical protein